MYKTHTCGELRASHVGETITLAGWVHNFRNHGGVTFIDLRDRFGMTQIVGNPEVNAELAPLKAARSEWVLQVTGEVRKRVEGAENPNLATGEIEVDVKEVKVLNKAKILPILINKDEEVDEHLRLKYRYLDLRRETMRRNLELRHKTIKFIRDYLDNNKFLEIETPILFKTTPEGARDYLVPSRVHPGQFYALPQSPQIFKQLLMNKYVLEKVMPEIRIDTMDVRNFYQANKDSRYNSAPYDSVKAQVFMDYQGEKAQQAFTEYIEQLAEKEHVEIFEQNVK